MQNSQNWADLHTLAYTLKTVWASGLSNGIEIFLFDDVKVKFGKTRALFSKVARTGEWKNAVISKQTYLLTPSSRSYIVLALRNPRIPFTTTWKKSQTELFSWLLSIKVYHLTKYSLTQTAAWASTFKSNLFIQIHPEFMAAGTSPIEKLQIQRFIKPWHVVSFQLEYLGQIPFVVSLSKSEMNNHFKISVSEA